MSKDGELNIKLYAITQGALSGPIAFGTYQHHSLNLISNHMYVLELPEGEYQAYRPATDALVDTERTLRELKIREGESIVLFRDIDLEIVKLAWKVIKPEEPPAAAAPGINVSAGFPGIFTISTDVKAWASRLWEKLRGPGR